MALRDRALRRQMKGDRHWFVMSDGVDFSADESREEDAALLRVEATPGAVNVRSAVHCRAVADVELRATIADHQPDSVTKQVGAGEAIELGGSVSGSRGELVNVALIVAGVVVAEASEIIP